MNKLEFLKQTPKNERNEITFAFVEDLNEDQFDLANAASRVLSGVDPDEVDEDTDLGNLSLSHDLSLTADPLESFGKNSKRCEDIEIRGIKGRKLDGVKSFKGQERVDVVVLDLGEKRLVVAI